MEKTNELREKLVRCTRMMNMLGLVEQNGHISVRVPETDSFIIPSQVSGRGTLTGKDVLTLDLQGRLLEGQDKVPGEAAIHTRIYQSRDDVFAIAHTHSHYAKLLSMCGERLVPVCNDGILFAQGVPLFLYSWKIDNNEKGEALARTIGNAIAVLMRGHGAVIVHGCLETVFQLTISLGKNARTQCELMPMGRLIPFSSEDIEQAPSQSTSFKGGWKAWNHYEALGQKNGLFD